MANIKILCIHGIGGKEFSNEKKWQEDWANAFQLINFTQKDHIHFMDFDIFFKETDANWRDYLEFFCKTFRLKSQQKGKFKDFMDNYPDMVIEFLLEEGLRKNLRNELRKYISETKPDVIYAHSLGSLICYDFFTQPENSQYNNIILVTSGSQLGNPYLENHALKFPTDYLPIKFWYNLNNPNDKVFANYPINLLADGKRFKEIKTVFSKSIINHDGLEYIKIDSAKKEVWNVIKNELVNASIK